MSKLQAHFHAAQLDGYSNFTYRPKFKGAWCIEAQSGPCLLRTIYDIHA